ncbi:MAG: glycoside hydrolase family 10 protein [Calditrichia bacterium]
MRLIVCMSLILLVMPEIIFPANEIQKPVRGLWVVRYDLKTPSGIDSLLKLAAKYQFTDLFVQVRGRGDAYYASNYEPRAEGLSEDFDPLKYLLQENHAYGFRIHAWINVLFIWSSEVMPQSQDHLVYLRPDWFVFPAKYSAATNLLERKANSEGLFNSPFLPEVRDYLLRVIDDILSQYDVDGLHLDYIRYPGNKFDFHPRVRAAFKKKYILDPLEFKNNKDQFVEKYGINGYELYYERWTRFLSDGLSGLVKLIHQRVKEKYPGIILSAAVKADLWAAHYRFYQDWDQWLKQGWLDVAIPMNYAVDKMEFLSRIRTMLRQGMMEKLWIGISLYNQSTREAIEKIKVVDGLLLNGFVLFSYSQLKSEKEFKKYYLKNVLIEGSKKP